MAQVRQERAVRTREAIIQAASVIFDRLGYEVASITDILQEAGLTKGALYFHFPSKEALARAVMASQVDLVQVPEHHLRVQSAIGLTLDVAAKLQTDPVMRAGIRLTIEQGSWQSASIEPYLAWIEITHQLFEEAGARGELKADVDPREAATLVVGSFTGIQLLSQVMTERKDLPQRIGTFWDLVLPGMVTPRILKRLTTAPSSPD